MATYPNGIEEIGLASIDPLHFTDATLTRGGAGPVSLNLKLPDGTVNGWNKMKVKKVMYGKFLCFHNECFEFLFILVDLIKIRKHPNLNYMHTFRRIL